MIRSLLRRIIYVFILLWVISMIAFWLSRQVPGDVVMDYISIDERDYNTAYNPVKFRRTYQRVAELRGLDLPEFYFSIAPAYVPDSLKYILPKDDRDVVRHWIHSSKNGEASMALYDQLRSGLVTHCDSDRLLCDFYNQALTTPNAGMIRVNADIVSEKLLLDSTRSTASKSQIESIGKMSAMLKDASHLPAIKLLPVFYWHGTHNQYHRWMKGLLYQEPLTSLVDGRNAWSKIYDALKWTILLNGFAFMISMLLGVLIGIWSGIHDGQPKEKIVNWILFALFAVPSFWLGTLFIYFLASGEWLSILPSGGLGDYHGAGNLIERWGIISSHLFLPVMCLALGALAYVSRQMKQSVLHEYDQPYVTMLRAQGISEKTILRRHVIGNALFPVITMMGGAIPALLSGSLIIEIIFSIPGMGRLMYNSLMSRDWPVAFPILMFGALITILSYIITDIVYKWADPRVKVLQS